MLPPPTDPSPHTRALIARAAFGVFRCDAEGTLLDANPAFLGMLGLEQGALHDALRLPDAVFLDRADAGRWRDAVRDGRADEWLDVHCRRQDGESVRLRFSITVERDESGRITGVHGIAENITERLRRDELLRRGERMAALGRTLAGVAHEINNPLAAISGYTQILLKGERTAEDRHALDTILQEARRAARIVKDLLTIARREEVVERTRLDLNAIVSYIVDTQRYAIETRGIQVVTELAAGSAWIIGDAAQVEQVVLNLVVNARESLESILERGTTPHEGWHPVLRVATAALPFPGAVRLDVMDNGPGIPASDLSHIWDPFWTTRDADGSGLGLSVVHSIVTSHGGTIDVASRLGVETRFTVTVPAAPAEVRLVTTAAATRPVTAVRRPLDVLVIDDERAIRDLLARLLTARGHAVLVAANGTEALRLAEHAAFDVVVSDLRMPGMDGRELIRRLRLHPSLGATRFILATGDAAAAGAMAHAGGGGAPDVAVVDKPYDVDTLLLLVEEGGLPPTSPSPPSPPSPPSTSPDVPPLP